MSLAERQAIEEAGKLGDAAHQPTNEEIRRQLGFGLINHQSAECAR